MTSIIVVGAGLLGAGAAEQLAGRGADVTIVERDRPGGGTSGASFAWINAQDKAPQAYFELNLAGVRAYPELAARLGGDWYHPGGDLILGRGPGLDKVRERIERHRDKGYPVTELDRAGVLALEPDLALADEPLVAGHFPAEAWVDGEGLAERLVAAATAAGARLVRGEVAELLRAGPRVVGVRTADGAEHLAEVVVLAAGPATEALAATAGVALPMAPSPGLLVTVGPVAAPIRDHIVHAGDVALRPDGPDRVLLSSREVDAGLDPGTRALAADAPEVAELVRRAARLLPTVADAPIERVRVGVRSVPTDGQPAVGPAPDAPGLYLLVSHSGASLGPVLARLVADELLGEPAAELADYRLDRFAVPA